MFPHIIFVLATLAFSLLVASAPVFDQSITDGFSVKQVRNDNYIHDGRSALYAAYQRHHINVPESLKRALDGRVVDTPDASDNNYLVQANIDGQTISVVLDTGSLDL
jgi:hypothetical protein